MRQNAFLHNFDISPPTTANTDALVSWHENKGQLFVKGGFEKSSKISRRIVWRNGSGLFRVRPATGSGGRRGQTSSPDVVEEEEKKACAAVQAAVIRLHDLLVRVQTLQ